MSHQPKTPRYGMILAAGLGTRLLPLTETTPKPMLPLLGKPLIGHQLASLAAAGVSDVIINVHHLREQITEYVGTGDKFGVSVHYSYESELLETGGAIRKVRDHFDEQPFWLLNGDIWTDFNFTTLPSAPPSETAHLVLTPTPTHRDHGDFECDPDGLVTSRGDTYVYCGIAALHPRILDLEKRDAFSLRDIYFQLIKDRQLTAQIHPGYWHDIGTLSQYEALARKYPAPTEQSGPIPL